MENDISLVWVIGFSALLGQPGFPEAFCVCFDLFSAKDTLVGDLSLLVIASVLFSAWLELDADDAIIELFCSNAWASAVINIFNDIHDGARD